MRMMTRTMISAIVAIMIAAGLQLPNTRPALAAEARKSETTKLGRQKIAGYTVSVIMIGDPHDQETVEFDVKLIDAKDDPKALRIWIGDENTGEKVTMQKKKTTYGATVKVPSPLPEDAKVWAEVETESTTAKASYSMEHEHNHKH